MCWTQKFSFSRDPVIHDLKLQLALLPACRALKDAFKKILLGFQVNFLSLTRW